MQLSLNEGTTYMQSTLEKDLYFTGKYGYDCIELRMDMINEFLKNHSIEELKNLIVQSKVKPNALDSLEDFNLIPDSEFKNIKKEFEKMCMISDKLDCRVVIVVPSKNKGNFAREVILDNAVDCLLQFSDIAIKYNIKVGFEFVGHPEYSITENLRESV